MVGISNKFVPETAIDVWAEPRNSVSLSTRMNIYYIHQQPWYNNV